jgi:hypothetical protein
MCDISSSRLAAVFFVNKILAIVISIVNHHDFPLYFELFLVNLSSSNLARLIC